MASLIGALRVSLSADTAQFSAGMTKAQRQAATSAAGINKSLGTIKAGLTGFTAGLSIGLLSQGIKAALNYASSIAEVAQQLGVTSKDLQVFRYAAGQVGVSQDQLETGLQKLTITLGKVAAGAAAPTKALNAIGISAKDLAGLDAGAAFRKIADGLAPVTDRAKRAAVEVALFGKSGANLDNLLSGGSKAINELSSAAEKLGIVLSDEQIQRADDTADKLEALRTVLAAQISGVVADNAGAILSLAGALGSLTNSIIHFLGSNPMGALAILGAIAGSRFGIIGAAGGAFAGATAGARMGADNQEAALTGSGANKELLRHNLVAERNRLLAKRKAGQPIKVSEVDRLNRLRTRVESAYGTTPAPTGGADIGQFLAPSGGGGRHKKAGGDGGAAKAERERLSALREAFRIDDESRRADMDILRAKKDIAPTFIERAALDMQMLDLERADYKAGLDNQVAMGEMKQAQADQLLAKYDITDGLKRQAVNLDEEEQRQRTYNALDDKDFEIQRDTLQKKSDLAQTAGERRALELEILKLEYDHRRLVLERIMRESKDYAEIEGARRELANLPAQQRADTQGVIAGTRGPLEAYMASLPDTAAKANEALQGVAANGLKSLEDGIMGVIDGTQKLGEAFKNVAKSIIMDLIRIQLQKAIVGTLGKLLGGLGGVTSTGSLGGADSIASSGGGSLPAFATGGGFTILGRKGVDRNIMSLNGLPIARVNHGERVNIGRSNANAQGGGAARVTIVPTPYFDAHVDGRAAQVAAPMAQRAAMVGAAGGQQATMRQAQRRIP